MSFFDDVFDYYYPYWVSGSAKLSRLAWKLYRSHKQLNRIGTAFGNVFDGRPFLLEREGYMSEYLNDDFIIPVARSYMH